MIDCPECMEPIKGHKCACGYVVPRTVFNRDQTVNPETELTEYSRRCLEAWGVHKPGMTRAQKTQANKDYIKQLLKSPKPDGHAWARKILEDVAEGVWVNSYSEACAREVLKRPMDEQQQEAA